MNQRIQKFLGAENISQSQFADTIGVARASISHILSGRNKPGFDFIEKVSQNYPNLNLEWLITGKGKMYKNAYVSVGGYTAPEIPSETDVPERDLFSVDDSRSDYPAEDLFTTSLKEPLTKSVAEAESKPESEPEPVIKSEIKAVKAKETDIRNSPAPGRSISKIIVFYSDSTFQELK